MGMNQKSNLVLKSRKTSKSIGQNAIPGHENGLTLTEVLRGVAYRENQQKIARPKSMRVKMININFPGVCI